MTTADALTLDVDDYHTLRGIDRDHLLAAAVAVHKRETLPPGAGVTDTVGRMTGNMPTRSTSRAALERLAEAGLIERVPGVPDDRARGVRVTPAGYDALFAGARRLEAAATAAE